MRENQGWKYTFAAGFVPLLAGLLVLLTSWISVLNPKMKWTMGLSHLDFTYGQINQLSTKAGSYLEVIGSVGGVNIIGAAVAVIVVSRFALKTNQKWAWWLLLFSFLWIGLHDAYEATRFFIKTNQPLFLLPYTYCLLMGIGLYKSREVRS